MGEPDKIKWRGVRPTNPEEVFTRYEAPHGATYIDSLVQLSNGYIIVYTVPNGKTLYLASVNFTVYMGIAGTYSIRIRDGGDNYVGNILDNTVAVNLPVFGSICYPIAKQIPQNYDIVGYTNSANIVMNTNVTGYLR